MSIFVSGSRGVRTQSFFWGSLALAALALTGTGRAAGFTNASLSGGYGCLGNFQAAETEVIQLNSDKKGHITSGSLSVNQFAGEVCNYSISAGTYSINPSGTGKLAITVNGGTGVDADDTACSSGNGVTEHFVIVLESHGGRFEFSADDDFETGGALVDDQGDIVFFGSCTKQ